MKGMPLSVVTLCDSGSNITAANIIDQWACLIYFISNQEVAGSIIVTHHMVEYFSLSPLTYIFLNWVLIQTNQVTIVDSIVLFQLLWLVVIHTSPWIL